MATIKRIATFDKDDIKAAHPYQADEDITKAQEAAKALLQVLNSSEVQQAVQAARDALNQAKTLSPAAGNALTVAEARVTDLFAHAAASAQAESEYWTRQFHSVQERAEQWFTAHARRITICAAFVVAFGLQLDVFRLFNQLSSDSEFRKGFVQKRAEEALNAKFHNTIYSGRI